MRGKVDIYCTKFGVLARKWPRNPVQPGTPAQQVAWDALTLMHTTIKAMPSALRAEWQTSVSTSHQSGEDLLRKSYLNLAYAAAIALPPLVHTITFAAALNPAYIGIIFHLTAYPDFDREKLGFCYASREEHPDPERYLLDHISTNRQSYGDKMYRLNVGFTLPPPILKSYRRGPSIIATVPRNPVGWWYYWLSADDTKRRWPLLPCQSLNTP